MAIAKTPPRSRWQGPLLAGLCFGLGYGLTQRLLALQLPAFVQLGEGFELRQFPGTSLDSLRLRFGAESRPPALGQQPEPQEAEKPLPEPALEPDPLAAPQAGSGAANLERESLEAVPPAPSLPAPQLPAPAALPQP